MFEVVVRLHAGSIAEAARRVELAVNDLPALMNRQRNGHPLTDLEFNTIEQDLRALTISGVRLVEAREVSISA